MPKGRVVMGLWFFPRGGSAYVARYLSRALSNAGWSVALVCGSLGVPGAPTNAATFFAGLDVEALHYAGVETPLRAGSSSRATRSPVSYEDRLDESDVVLSSVSPGLADALASGWEEPFAAADIDLADVLHLHHLTPQHDVIARRWPRLPVLAHLHGTELKFIQAIEERAAVAARLGQTLATMPAVDVRHDPGAVLDETQSELLVSTRWDRWRYGTFWADHLRAQANAADQLVAVSSGDRATATDLLGVEPERIAVIPNGVDLERFRPMVLTRPARRASFRRWLVEDPQGWDEATGKPGSVTYRDADLDRLLGRDGDATLLITVGRFTAAKRVPLLIRAFARARNRFARTTSLVVWGGSSGEWEGEHPITVATEVGSDGIFFTGWRGHDELPSGLAACDALVMASVDDSYPQAPLEAMAVGLPVIATRSGGFPAMVVPEGTSATGWLVAPDDVDALADGLVEVVNRPAEIVRRGRNALTFARENFSWKGLVPRFEAAYAATIEHHQRAAGVERPSPFAPDEAQRGERPR